MEIPPVNFTASSPHGDPYFANQIKDLQRAVTALEASPNDTSAQKKYADVAQNFEAFHNAPSGVATTVDDMLKKMHSFFSPPTSDQLKSLGSDLKTISNYINS